MADIDRLLKLAAKTGKLYVAPDVFKELMDQTQTEPVFGGQFTLRGIRIIKSELFPKGAMFAANTDEFFSGVNLDIIVDPRAAGRTA